MFFFTKTLPAPSSGMRRCGNNTTAQGERVCVCVWGGVKVHRCGEAKVKTKVRIGRGQIEAQKANRLCVEEGRDWSMPASLTFPKDSPFSQCSLPPGCPPNWTGLT
uniref:Uncharacterized protein n=1 Tax=Anopheles gambiae TaxID=7165 RepID=A0A1S4GWM0_ANOGA